MLDKKRHSGVHAWAICLLMFTFAVSFLFASTARADDYSHFLNDERYRRLYELYLLFRQRCFGDDIQIYSITTEQNKDAAAQADGPQSRTFASLPEIKLSFKDSATSSESQTQTQLAQVETSSKYSALSSDMIEINGDISAATDQTQRTSQLQRSLDEATSQDNETSSDVIVTHGSDDQTQEQLVEISSQDSPNNSDMIEKIDATSSDISRDKSLIMDYIASADISPRLITREDRAVIFEAVKRVYRVVKGDCLWMISRREFGRGSLWRTIFGLNSDMIRDPDLIYPDQEFQLPAGE